MGIFGIDHDIKDHVGNDGRNDASGELLKVTEPDEGNEGANE